MIFSNIYNVRDLFESAIQSLRLVWWLIKSISFFFVALCCSAFVFVFFLFGSCLFVLLILKINMFLFSSLGGHLS